jgi:hypothetical protein
MTTGNEVRTTASGDPVILLYVLLFVFTSQRHRISLDINYSSTLLHKQHIPGPPRKPCAMHCSSSFGRPVTWLSIILGPRLSDPKSASRSTIGTTDHVPHPLCGHWPSRRSKYASKASSMYVISLLNTYHIITGKQSAVLDCLLVLVEPSGPYLIPFCLISKSAHNSST